MKNETIAKIVCWLVTALLVVFGVIIILCVDVNRGRGDYDELNQAYMEMERHKSILDRCKKQIEQCKKQIEQCKKQIEQCKNKEENK